MLETSHTTQKFQFSDLLSKLFAKISYVPVRFNGNTDLLTSTKLASLAGIIHKVCTLRGGSGWGLAGQKVYWLKWRRGWTFGCKFMYVMNFFRSLKINRNKVKVGYSHSQLIYLAHAVTKHKLNPRALFDVV